MIKIMDFNDLMQAFDDILKDVSYAQSQKTHTCKTSAQASHPQVSGFWCPAVKRVTFNGNTTVVFFTDSTYAVVTCSASDKYDKKTAVAYAIVKRLLGKLGKVDKNGKFHANEVDGAGFGTYLQKIIDAGFDQQEEEKLAAEKKQKAHEEHVARQKLQQDAAFKRRVEERAKQILLERAAIDRANEIEDKKRESIKSCSCLDKKPSKKCSCAYDEYVKPDKPFAQFTPEEKREYWRWHNAKRRASKKSN